MKRIFLTVTCFLYLALGNARQTAATTQFDTIPAAAASSVTSMANWLQQHHQGNQRKILQSLYGWMAENIRYDMVNTYLPDYYKDTADAVNKTLKTHVAVCQGYASLFMEVARQAHIPAQLVTGYTFSQNKLDNSSHAWVAVFTDNQWRLVDPTWGSGAVINGHYTKRLNWNYFLVAPEQFIKHHVPFDPLFQFLDNPYTHPEILNGKTEKRQFAYGDTLAWFNRLSTVDKADNAAARIARFGVTNQLIGAELQNLRNIVSAGRQNMLVDEHNRQASRINSLSSRFNEVVGSYNEYVEFKNKQFSPSKPDNDIRAWVDEMYSRLSDIDKQLNEIVPSDNNIATNIGELKAAENGLRKKVAEEQAFVDRYIKTGKLFRKTLFYKFGR